jgi:hypothetical protein
MARMRAVCPHLVLLTEFRVVSHNFAHQLLDHVLAGGFIVTGREFCDCLRHRDNHFVGVNRIWFTRCRRVIRKKVVDLFNNQAMQARPFLV